MLSNGDSLLQRYRIEKVLGQGGMGAVYEATDVQKQMQVAIKEVDATGLEDGPALLEQFAVEAQMLRGMSHPGLPRVYDFFAADDRHYLVMELIPGKTLDLLSPAERPKEREVLEWSLAVAEVLEYLHSQSPPIIFRDLKPGNVMLDSSGHIKLIDFGIAKPYDARAVTKTVIRGAGTPGYAPPEQYFGRTDVRTDLYALGATMFGLLTWRSPPDPLALTTSKTSMTRVRHLQPDVSAPTDDLVFELMQVQRNRRPGSAGYVIQRLQAILYPDGVPRPASAAPELQPAPKADKPRARMLMMASAVVVVVAIAIALTPWIRSLLHRMLHR